MIATLGPHFYAALLAALALLAAGCCLALIRRPSLLRLGWLVTTAGLFVAASWPALGGRLLFHARCHLHAGLQVQAPVDARDTGYLLPSPQPPWGRFDYFPHGILDLVQGRVRFFEVEESSGRYIRYALASTHSTRCIARKLAEQRLAGLTLPRGRCLAASEESAPASRYELIGYAGAPRRMPREVALRERRAGPDPAEPVARYRWFRHSSPFAGVAACPVNPVQNTWHPLWNLTSFALLDADGAVVREADLPALEREQAADGSAPTVPELQLIPSAASVHRELAGRGLLPEGCEPLMLPDDTLIYTISAQHGGAQIDARLDSTSERADFVIVDLNLPDQPVAIVAEAELPTLWHVHLGRQAQLAAFLVRGRHGQGVEGMVASTELRMSTELHNPRSHCSEAELAAMVKAIGRRYPQRSAGMLARPEPGRSLHFLIGEPMRDGQQSFTFQVPRSAFELVPEPAMP